MSQVKRAVEVNSAHVTTAAASSRTIFFAAFEPSGDILAAKLIGELKRRDPGLRFTGFGGPEMQAQGAELIQVTTEHAAIALGALGEVKTHLKRCGVMSDWLKANDLAAFVPVDSPAANWALCKRVRQHKPKAKIVHMVCPQIWGWATWRIRRLRKLTDRVLCLLPFEPGWLDERGVLGTFVGHPVFEDAAGILDAPAAEDLPVVQDDQAVRVALMPGSRPSELKQNWPTMLAAYSRVLKDCPGMVGVVAARTGADEAVLRSVTGEQGWPLGLSVVGGRTPEVLRWADVALVKSGTSTLQVASLRRPMVAFYNVDPLKWHALGRWLIKSRTFALPNIISEWRDGRRAVPEFVPHFGDPAPIAEAVRPLVADADKRQAQSQGLERVCEPFASVRFKDAAAQAFLEEINGV